MRATAMLLERKREDMIGMLERTLAVAVRNGVFRKHVASNSAVHERRCGLGGVTTVGDGCKRLVVDFDARRSVLGDRAVFRNDNRNRFPDIANLVTGEDKRRNVLA